MNDKPNLEHITLFEGLDQMDLDLLARIGRQESFNAGETIFSENDRALGFHVILAGRVKVYKLSAEGKEQVLHLFGPGEPIGEAAVFEGGRFPAHAQALEPSWTMFFPRDMLLELFAVNPTVAMNMLAVLSKRLKRFTRTIEELTLRQAPQRLAAYILDLAERENGDKVRLSMSKGLLANVLGVSAETLSRALARLSQDGLIKVNGRDIRILDMPGLEDLVMG